MEKWVIFPGIARVKTEVSSMLSNGVSGSAVWMWTIRTSVLTLDPQGRFRIGPCDPVQGSAHHKEFIVNQPSSIHHQCHGGDVGRRRGKIRANNLPQTRTAVTCSVQVEQMQQPEEREKHIFGY